MKARDFVKLSVRDFENGAVRDEIYNDLKQKEALQSERERIVRGNFTQICSYCGEEMVGPSQWEKLQDHIQNCDKHPLKIMKDKVWHMEAEITALREAGCSNCQGVIEPPDSH